MAQKRFPGVVLHSHVTNPTEEVISIANVLRDKYPWFGFSTDTFNFNDNQTKRLRMAYFAAARYIYAVDIINLYDSPIVITDIDIELDNGYAEVIELSKKSAASFSAGVLTLNKYYPWVRVSAQLSIFQASKMGRRIAQYVSRYLLTTIDLSPQARPWCADQNALWHAYEKFKDSIAHTRLAALGRPQK